MVLLSQRISVIVTAYHRREFLVEAVKSVLENDYPSEYYEIVVAKNFEDSSIDKFLLSNRVKIILTEDTNIGEQIYQAVSKSDGDILCFLDDDDRFKPNKLMEINSVFSEYTDLVYYHNQTDSIDDQSDFLPGNIHRKITAKVTLKEGSADEIGMIFKSRSDFTLYSLMFNLSCVAIRRKVLLPFLNYLRRIIDGTDWFVFYCGLLYGELMLFDTKVLTDYRVHRSVSNIFTSDANLKEIAQFTISKFDKEGHFSIVLSEFCLKTKVEQLIKVKLLEEKIVTRILSERHQRVTLKEYLEYLRSLRYVAHPSMKSMSMRFGLIFLSLFLPSISGIFYSLYRRHSLMSRLSSKSV